MLALTTTGTADLLALSEVDEPEPTSSQVLVRVLATSLNRGEVSRAKQSEAGQHLGWDVVGLVEREAAASGGPPLGSTVVGLVDSGAWAERVALAVEHLAVVPAAVSVAQAACLPVAGMTAVRALSAGGFGLRRRVLVTGASGGVGHLAVQVARAAGMTVTGLIRTPTASPDATAACHHVLEDLDEASGEYDLILEGVGGGVLSRCLDLVAPRGVVVSYASTLMEEATLAPRWFGAHLGATLRSMLLFEELHHTASASADLGLLCELIEAGQLIPHVAAEAGWERGGELARDLLERRVAGKVVLHVSG